MNRAMNTSLGAEPIRFKPLGFPANLQVHCAISAGFADKHPNTFAACLVTALRDQIGADRVQALLEAMVKEASK